MAGPTSRSSSTVSAPGAASAQALSCRAVRAEWERAACFRIRHQVFVCEQRLFLPPGAGHGDDRDRHDADPATIHVAGLVGALVATLAMCGPTCVFAFYVSQVWERFKDAPWRAAIQTGLLPISIGLIAAMLAFTAVSGAYITPRASAISREVIGPISALPATDPKKEEFDRLHKYSNWLFAATALAGFVLLAWEARE